MNCAQPTGLVKEDAGATGPIEQVADQLALTCCHVVHDWTSQDGNPRLALQAYLIAVSLRPDKPDYRRQLALAVVESGGPARALGTIDTLLAGHEDNGALWLERAMLLRQSGRAAESAAAQRRALELEPGLATVADTLPALAAR